MKHKNSSPAELIAKSLKVAKHAKNFDTPPKTPQSDANTVQQESPPVTETTTEVGQGFIIIDGIVCEVVD